MSDGVVPFTPADRVQAFLRTRASKLEAEGHDLNELGRFAKELMEVVDKIARKQNPAYKSVVDTFASNT